MSNESQSMRLRKVCLICGNCSALMINIYEPRSGPNIVDVINQKFKVQLVNEDKFLCYSCNNWLINWHSLQNKNQASSSKANKNISRTNQSIPEEHQRETMPVLVDHHFEIVRLRSRLKKYIYYPKKVSKFPKSAKQRLRAKCNLCGASTINNKRSCRSRLRNRVAKIRCLQVCHKRKQTVRECFNASSTFCYLPSSSFNQREILERSSQSIRIHPYVLSRLKNLGTTVVSEGAASSTANDLSHSITSRMNNKRKIDSVIQSKPNEFVISFDTMLQEVFPVDLCEQNYEDVVVEEISDLKEMCKRIPKSLTITLA